MGLGISYDASECGASNEALDAAIDSVKRLAAQAGYSYFETRETGIATFRTTDNGLNFASDRNDGAHPILRAALRKSMGGCFESACWELVVSPPGVESFCLRGIRGAAGEWRVKSDGVTKTTPFTNDNVMENFSSHVWIITALQLVKKEIPWLKIEDDLRYYHGGTDEKSAERLFRAMHITQDAAREIDRAMNSGEIQLTEVVSLTPPAPDDAVISTGHLLQDGDYQYCTYDHGRLIMMGAQPCPKKVIMLVDVPEEIEHEPAQDTLIGLAQAVEKNKRE